jgi:NAD(P)H-flavin reductase
MGDEDLSQITKRVYICECTNFAFVAADTVSLEFFWPGPAPRSGQFFLVKPKRTGVFLARPISVAGFKPRKATGKTKASGGQAEKRSRIADRRQKADPRIKFDRRINIDRRWDEGGLIRFLVVRRGQGSRDIVDIRPGEEAELIGPLGNFWPLNDTQPNFYKRKPAASPVALVGGGIGVAPLLAIVSELEKKPYDFYAGFRTGSFGLEDIKPNALIIATEDGSAGVKGRILDFFTPKGYSRVFACGPKPMLKAVSDICIAGGIPCFICIEKHMACGVGACLGCNIKTIQGNRRCCTDGPIFNAKEICFEE